MEKNNSEKHLFSNHDLWMLLVPLVVEQLLNSLMGTADSIMVSNVGSAAISAVSLVDSINILVYRHFMRGSRRHHRLFPVYRAEG